MPYGPLTRVYISNECCQRLSVVNTRVTVVPAWTVAPFNGVQVWFVNYVFTMANALM
jgi:hypothetical protein